MRIVLVLSALAAIATPASRAAAQPATDAADRDDAKALLQSGLKLFAAKDYLGALAVFRDGYARFPSAKFLLNIGTTLSRLDRKAEAANTYQRYLDAADADPKKKPEVEKALVELDRAVATLALAITPADAEVQIDGGEWLASTAGMKLRVTPGVVVVRARAPRHQAGEQTVTATAGAARTIELALTAIVETPRAPAEPAGAGTVNTGVMARVARPPSRFGALIRAHGDVVNPGVAGLVGVAANVTGRLQVQAAALLGAQLGGYAGATFAVWEHPRVRPIVVAGFPIYASDGARVGVRGAGGVELPFGRHLSVIAEVGVEHVLNAEPDVEATVFVPAIGAIGRL